jgi:hypothetical protein
MTTAIHAAINRAMADIAKTGIAKDKSASLGGAAVQYRGIEAAMNQMSAILIAHKITVTPTYSEAQFVERVKGAPADGKATRFALVRGVFRFASAEDGSFVDCACYGEAMDSGDKAMTKAQSVAFRTALFQQFVVPTMAMDPEAGGDGEGAETPPMPPADVARFKARLLRAESRDLLRTEWAEADHAARAAQDGAAYAVLKAAKDERLKALAAIEAAQP